MTYGYATLPDEEITPEIAEYIEKMETMYALGTGKHFRTKLKELAERCKNPVAGRLVFKSLYIRKDALGNPELVVEGSPALRFNIESITISKQWLTHREYGGNLKQIVDMYTDYVFAGYPHQGIMPKNYQEQIKEYPHHTSDARSCGCDVCKQFPEYFAAIKEQNAKHDAFVQSILNKEEIQELPISNNMTGQLPNYLEEAYRAMIGKRGWVRKGTQTAEAS